MSMERGPFRKAALYACVSLTTLSVAGAAMANGYQEEAGQDSGQEAVRLEEVVVTATRQSSNVNRVALTVAAVTAENLDQQGIKNATDLQKAIPALTLVGSQAGVGTFAIRGIVATTGAATTGVYLDDTALTKRNNAGVAQNNGAPLPTLFDLERVEVLKGPQGTLYGGSSQGGTIRFITPTPSLVGYSGRVQAETSIVEDGEESYELGLAFGGPIFEDKLGFRVSGLVRETGGWIDMLNPYDNGSLYREDANGRSEEALRAALLWQLNDRARLNLSYYHSAVESEGGPGAPTTVFGVDGRPSNNLTYTTPAVCYDNSNRLPGTTSAPVAVACPTGPLPTGWFRREAQTYGPFNYLGDDDSISQADGRLNKSKTTTDLVTLTYEYDFDNMSVKSITSFVKDETTGLLGESHDIGRLQRTVENPLRGAFPLFAPVPSYAGNFTSINEREGIQQEFRFSSDPEQRFNWVAGLFFSDMETKIFYTIPGDYDAAFMAFYGIDTTSRYGIPPAIPGDLTAVSLLDATLRDTELAAFGEANFKLTDKIKLTAGGRQSQVTLDFTQVNYGQLSARPGPDAPYASVSGSAKDSPFTPKYGVQYQLTETNMLYANAAKGFRAGGVNVPLNPQVCNTGLAQFGLTVDDIPRQFGPDEVWSYEAGGKFRLLDGRMQVNVAAFQIDWTNIQVTTSAQGCGQNWNQNGGTARSQGFDLQTEFRPTRDLRLSASLAYTDAKYTEAVLGPQPLVGNAAVIFHEDDPLGVPKWQANIGARYDFFLFGSDAYVRADYQYQGEYEQSSGYGTGNYNPHSNVVEATDMLNLRFGMHVKDVEVSVFANNALNSRDKVGNAGIGQTACSTTGPADCSVYNQFNPFVSQAYQRPRSVGIQVGYRF